MKYMTFNSSCTYAALANMLEKKGTDVEDYEIALEMKLPFLIDRNEDGFVAGPMILKNLDYSDQSFWMVHL